MSRKQTLRAELDELHAGLVQPASGQAHISKDDIPDWVKDLNKTGLELQAKFAEVAEDAEDIVSAHPLVAVATAFLLGVVVGRMMGRSR